MLNKIFKSRKKKATFVSKIDSLFLKNNNKVLFVVKDRTYFSGNLRVTLEAFLKYSDKDIFIYKDGLCSHQVKNEYSKDRVTILNKFCIKSLWHILTSGTVILSHNPRDVHITKKISSRKIINLWHGVAIKKIELLMTSIESDKLKLLKNNRLLYDTVIASSEQDKITNAKAFGVSEEMVEITGLPRYEILKKDYVLSSLLQRENDTILSIKKEKKLVLYAPTFRKKNISIIDNLSSEEWGLLDEFSEKNGILFGIRPHSYDNTTLYKIIKQYRNLYLFNSSEFTESNLLLKHVDLLVVDFSSIWIDYLLLNKPIIGFAKDYENYLHNERGFIYDYFKIFPDLFTDDVTELVNFIENKFASEKTIEYKKAKQIFHKYSLKNDFRQIIFETIEGSKV